VTEALFRLRSDALEKLCESDLEATDFSDAKMSEIISRIRLDLYQMRTHTRVPAYGVHSESIYKNVALSRLTLSQQLFDVFKALVMDKDPQEPFNKFKSQITKMPGVFERLKTDLEIEEDINPDTKSAIEQAITEFEDFSALCESSMPALERAVSKAVSKAQEPTDLGHPTP